MTLHHHPLSLNGTSGSQFTMSHEHDRGGEPHTHAVTPDGKSYTSTEFDGEPPFDRELIESDPVRAALLVLVESDHTRTWLAAHDPQALAQARAALAATTAGPSGIPVTIEGVVIQNDSMDHDGLAAICHVSGSEHFGVQFVVPIAGGGREAAEAVLRSQLDGAGVYHIIESED